MKMSYEEWKRLVDALLVEMCGLDSGSLPDYNYRDAYDSGKSARVTAKRAIARAREY